MSLFNNFKIDAWYKVCIYLGVIIFVGSIFTPTIIFDNEDLVLFGLGLFLFGLSSWKNQKGAIFLPNGEEIKIKENPLTQIKFMITKLLFIIGSILMIYSIYKIVIEDYIV